MTTTSTQDFDDYVGDDDSNFQIDEYDLTSTPNDFNILTLHNFIESGAVKIRFFTDLSTAPEAAASARDRGQSELVAPWPTSVSAAASVHRACLARGEGRP